MMIDWRTTRILGFVLLSERNYNAHAIRTLITKVADQYGLPRKGFYFENGIWKSSKLLKGDSGSEPMSWGETESGLREFGLRFKHASSAREKPVERTGGAVQNLMAGLPGYVGRNEMIEKYERVQKLKLQVETRKVHPAGHFLTEDQYCDALGEIFARYNAAPQDGEMTEGLSPDVAYDAFLNRDDPPVKFSAGCRYLLAHHKRPVKVGNNGVTLHFGKQVFNYRNEDTGRLIGQRVIAWFNPESPEILTITDMYRRNPISIERTQEVPAMDAPPELLAQELARIAKHQAYAKARYKILRPLRPLPFRPMVADAVTTELGREMDEQRQAIASAQREQGNAQAKARRISSELKIALPQGRTTRPEAISALEKLRDIFAVDEDGKSPGEPQ